MAEKQCTKCGEVKPLEQFFVRKESGRHRNECKACMTRKAKSWKQANRERANANNRASYHRDVERTREVAKEWRAVNKERVAEYAKKYVQNPEVKARKLEYDAQWKKANPSKVREYDRRSRANNPHTHKRLIAQRRAAQRKATPIWFEPDAVKRVYKEASQWGFEVDHVVPLVHPEVCGLHCWHNLQLLDRPTNIAKGNRHWPDM